MANVPYENFYLENEIEDQYNSHLDLQQFCEIDDSLEGTAGMKIIVNKYKATGTTEKLAKGQGNSQSIEVDYEPVEYVIQLAQDRFDYYDEDAAKDPTLVLTGVKHTGTALFNTVNTDIYAEFNKTPQVVLAPKFDFDAYVDAQSMLGLEELEGVTMFSFVNPADVAEIRKNMKDTLQYVEAYAKFNYIGTVAGVNIYAKKDAVPGKPVLAIKAAVKLMNKTGVEVEQTTKGNRSDEAANTRKNSIFARKYYVPALQDESKAVIIRKGTATLSSDSTASEDKTYYEKAGLGYVAVKPSEGDDPSTKGWYEIA